MKPTITTVPLQELPSGDKLSITVFTFKNARPGPSVYIQANLHGPEIIGSVILINLIQKLHLRNDLCGTLTLVPLANPIGVINQTYGLQHGRWNQQNGTNWNRIFSPNGPKQNPKSIEDLLSATLMHLATDHHFVLDIHACGSTTIPHIYTFTDSQKIFAPLAPEAMIIVEDNDYLNAFDESCRAYKKQIHSATWEAGAQGKISKEVIATQTNNLDCWLETIGTLPPTSAPPQTNPAPEIFSMKNLETLHSPSGGYLVWTTFPGDEVKTGETYATLLNPNTASTTQLIAEYPFMILAHYPLQAVAQGQELGLILRR